jgi:uncharacterized protein
MKPNSLQIMTLLKKHKTEILSNYNLSQMGIFGSYSRGEETAKSDVDILIDVQRPMGLLRFVHLKNHLHALLGIKVDLVMKSALKPALREIILRETRYL